MSACEGTRFVCLPEIPRAARDRVDDNIWNYIIGGTESETAVRRNRHALDRLVFKPRVLQDTSSIETGSIILGHPVSLPVMMAPIGNLQDITQGGAADTIRGTTEAGVAGIVGSSSRPELEIAADAGQGVKFFQLYIHGDAAWVDTMTDRADAAGFDALFITVDLDYYSIREKQLLAGYTPPSQQNPEVVIHRAGFTWEDVKRVRKRWSKPLVLKGIQTAEDAKIAADHGVDGVYISNHGGRALDHARASIDILGEVVAEIGGKAEIFVDGGILRATDLLKALALGANAVGLGRLHALSLAAGGVPGLVSMLALLKKELVTSMGLLGVSSLKELNPNHITTVPPMPESGWLTAYPFLELK